MGKLYFLFVFFLLLPSFSLGIPQFFNVTPMNNTFITGGSEYVFSVEIVESGLNESTVKLHIGSEEVWPDGRGIEPMSCYQISSDEWLCNASVPIYTTTSGVKEFYYFEASDTDGNTNTTGSLEDPYVITIDRSPPLVSTYSFENMSYVSESMNILVEVYDSLSGVNESALFWRYGNETWNSTWFRLLHEDGYYLIDMNTSELADNSSWKIYTNVSDILMNRNVSEIATVLVDNEFPSLEIVYPSSGENVFGSIRLSVRVSDTYSGIGSVGVEIDGKNYTLFCENNSCEREWDTREVENGLHTLLFMVRDNAGNTVEESLEVNVDNLSPLLSVIYPQNNSYVNGSFTAEIKVGNVVELKSASMRWYNITSSGEWVPMDCTDNLCTYDLELDEGYYTLEFLVEEEDGRDIGEKIQVVCDKTPPVLYSHLPSNITGKINLTLTSMDENGVNESKVWYSVDGYENSMSCNIFLSGKKLVCWDELDTSSLEEGTHYFTFTSCDLAGNCWSESIKTVISEEGIEKIENVTTTTTVQESGGGEVGESENTKIDVQLLSLVILSSLFAIIVIIVLLVKRREESFIIEE